MSTAPAGPSAAAAVVIATRGSAPVAGRLPELLVSRYALRAVPDLRAGHAQWCIALLERSGARWNLPAGEQCVGTSRPLVARGGLISLSPASGSVGAWLLWGVVDRRVASLRSPSGLRILPISSSALPAGWRAAVTIERRPAVRRGHSTIVELTPLDSAGRPIPAGTASPVALPTRSVAPAHHPAAGCRLRVRPGSGAELLAARTLAAPLPRTLPATGFLACYSLTVELAGAAGKLAVLVDAHHPGLDFGPIPGLRPLSRSPGIGVGSQYPDVDAGGLEHVYARRARRAWVVLATAAAPTRALALLRRIRASI
ncbi:MAG TPA: hypothetical protein VG293_07855 [Solirubrobacteraceae bacterium]|nr:hypothetical protein [Solirubrobacteraceae bacterium]